MVSVKLQDSFPVKFTFWISTSLEVKSILTSTCSSKSNSITLSSKAFDVLELEAVEVDTTGSEIFLSVSGFQLPGDVRMQEKLIWKVRRQVLDRFSLQEFFLRSSFLKCLEGTFVDSVILKSFPSSRLMACTCIHISSQYFFGGKLKIRLFQSVLFAIAFPSAFWNAAVCRNSFLILKDCILSGNSP